MIYLTSSSLERNVEKKFEIIKKIFLESDFSYNKNFLINRLQQSYGAMSNEITSSGHYIASILCSSKHKYFFSVLENWKGLSQIDYLKKVVQNLENESSFIDQFVDLLQSLHSFVLTRKIKFLFTAEKSFFSNHSFTVPSLPFSSDRFSFLSSSSDFNQGTLVQQNDGKKNDFLAPKNLFFVPIPSSVNYVCCSAFTSLPYVDPSYSSLRILSEITQSIYLHREVREKGVFLKIKFVKKKMLKKKNTRWCLWCIF